MDDPRPAKPAIRFDDFAKLDLRVARVLECREHPNADKLLIFKVDLGESAGSSPQPGSADGTRQICAALKGHYRPEDLIGKLVIIAVNVEPRAMKGEPSQGLLLSAAQGPMKQRMVILTPAADVPPGTPVG